MAYSAITTFSLMLLASVGWGQSFSGPVPDGTCGAPQTKASPNVYKVGGGVTAPALLYKVEPEYSEEARSAHLQGIVVLFVEVDPIGCAVNPKVVRTLGLGLDEKAIEAVRKWKFQPGTKDGKPVTVAATIEVNFRLLKDPAPPTDASHIDHPAAVGSADGRWMRVRSRHFDLSTSMEERRARELLSHLETAYEVMAPLTDASPRHRTKVVAFGSHAEYAPHQIRGTAAAYYDPEHDSIIIGDRSDDLVSVTHEYVHLIMAHANFRLPPWLNEGFADVYSTLTPRPDGVLIGTPPSGQIETLKNQWIPLNTLVAVDYESAFFYNAPSMHVFYAESFALTHMLILTNKYGHGHQDLMRMLSAGMPPEQAIARVYKESLAQIEVDLKFYLGKPFPTALLPVTVPVGDPIEDAPVELKASEVKHLLAHLPKAPRHHRA